jgi:transposase
MEKRKYDVGFKVKSVELLRASGKSLNEVAQELGIGASTLCKWSSLHQSGELASSGDVKPVVSSSDKEIARLSAELKRKTMEVEILKKATAFFAKNLI